MNEKMLNWIKKDYLDQEGPYIFGALLAAGLLPKILSSLTMLLVAQGLPLWLADAYKVAGILVAFFLCMRSLKLISSSRVMKRSLAVLADSALWLLAIALLNTMILAKTFPVSFIFHNMKSLNVVLIGYLLVRIIGYLLLGASVYACFIQMFDTRGSIHTGTLFCFTIRNFAVWSFGTFIVLIGAVLNYFVSVFLKSLNQGSTISFAGSVSMTVIAAAISFIFVKPVYNRYQKSAETMAEKVWEWQEKKEKQERKAEKKQEKKDHNEARKLAAEEKKAKKYKKDGKQDESLYKQQEDLEDDHYLTEAEREAREEKMQEPMAPVNPKVKKPLSPLVYRFLPFAVLLTICLVSVWKNPIGNRADAVLSSIAYDTAMAYCSGVAGDYAASEKAIVTAKAHILSWEGYLEDNPNLIQKAMTLDPEYIQPKLLMAYYRAEQGDSSLFEQELHRYPEENGWYFGLLFALKQQDELSEEQKNLRRDTLLYLISNEMYTDQTVIPFALSEKESEQVSEGMNLYERYLGYCNEFRVRASVMRNGRITMDTVDVALACSSEKRNNLLLAQIAYRIGSSCATDSTNEYDETFEAVRCFDDIFMQYYRENKKNKEAFICEKCEVASAMMQIWHYEDAIEVLREASKEAKSTEFDKLLAICYCRREEWETSVNYSEKVLKKEHEDTVSFYNLALCYLMSGDTKKSIENAEKLTELILKEENPASDSVMLYTYVQRFTIHDPNAKALWDVYEGLTPDLKALLSENDFLKKTMDINYQYFKNGGSTEQLAEVRELQKMKAEIPFLSYLEGNILTDLCRYEDADKAYKQSVALDLYQPHVWYSIAVMNMKAGNYEEAEMACEQVLMQIQEENHSTDRYGIAKQTELLMKLMGEKQAE